MYNGILIVDKPQDFTSHDVVAKLRGILKMRQIGHAGTLDPMATGVLVVLLGKATRASDYLLSQRKKYTATFELGITTDTQDNTGSVISTRDVCVTSAQVCDAVLSFAGKYEQLPPMYSAIQIDGKRLYDIARKGGEVERNTRSINIDEIEIVSDATLPKNTYKINVTCSKGTYIRTLCHDIGEKLGCGAVMTSLRRVSSGEFTVENAITLNELENIKTDMETIQKHITPTDMAFYDMPTVILNDDGTKRAKNGAFLEPKHIESGQLPDIDCLVRVYDNENTFLQIGIGGTLDIGPRCIFCKKSFI